MQYDHLTRIENNFPFRLDHEKNLWDKLIDTNEFVFDCFTQ